MYNVVNQHKEEIKLTMQICEIWHKCLSANLLLCGWSWASIVVSIFDGIALLLINNSNNKELIIWLSGLWLILKTINVVLKF